MEHLFSSLVPILDDPEIVEGDDGFAGKIDQVFQKCPDFYIFVIGLFQLLVEDGHFLIFLDQSGLADFQIRIQAGGFHVGCQCFFQESILR